MPPQKWRAGVVAPYEVGWQLPFLLLFSSWAAGTLPLRTLRAQRALICGSKCRKSSGRCLPACSHPKGNGVIRKRGETLCLPSCAQCGRAGHKCFPGLPKRIHIIRPPRAAASYFRARNVRPYEIWTQRLARRVIAQAREARAPRPPRRAPPKINDGFHIPT